MEMTRGGEGARDEPAAAREMEHAVNANSDMRRWQMRRAGVAAAAVLAMLTSPVAGQDLIPAGFKAHRRPAPGGRIDWGRGLLIAEGRSKAKGVTPQDRAMAARGAELIAARNAIALANGIPIDAEGRFGNVRDGAVHVRGVLRGHKRVSVDWRPNRNPPECIVRLSVPLWGVKGVASVLYEARRRSATAVAMRYRLIEGDVDVSDEVLVIDARGLGVEPCLFPAVVGPDGNVLYDVGAMARPAGKMTGPVRYVETTLTYEQIRAAIEGPQHDAVAVCRAADPAGGPGPAAAPLAALFALASFDDGLMAFSPPGGPTSRPASEPTTQPSSGPGSESKSGAVTADSGKPSRRRAVRALRTRPGDKTRIVLTKEDAEKLAGTPEGASLLREGRVVIVVDSVAAGAQGRGNPPPDRETLALAAD